MEGIVRCPWVGGTSDELYKEYHDNEWGVPVYDDTKLFEFLILESFQAGLSWKIILKKRNNFRKAFKNFDFVKVAKFSSKDVTKLLKNEGIVRNKLKILATINNAKAFINIRKEFGTFSKYQWSFVNGKPQVHKFEKISDYPEFTKEAQLLSLDMKKRGFKFLGPTVLYSHIQAVGMVNDHTTKCFRYREIKGLK